MSVTRETHDRNQHAAFMRSVERQNKHLCLAKPKNMPEDVATKITGMGAGERDRVRDRHLSRIGKDPNKGPAVRPRKAS